VVRRPEGEADHTPKPSAEVKITYSSISTHPYVFMLWSLVKHGDKFTLLIYEIHKASTITENKWHNTKGFENKNF